MGAFSWKAKAFSTTLSAVVSPPNWCVYSCKNSDNSFCCHCSGRSPFISESSILYSHSPQTFTTVIYHSSIFFSWLALLSHAGRFHPTPSWWLPYLPLISTPSCSICHLLFPQTLLFPFLLPNVQLYSSLRTATRISTETN